MYNIAAYKLEYANSILAHTGLHMAIFWMTFRGLFSPLLCKIYESIHEGGHSH